MKDFVQRVAALFGVAEIRRTDDTGGVQTAQVRYNDVEMRDNTQVAYSYGFTSRPLPGAHAITLSMQGNRTTTMVVSTHDPRHRPTNLAGGDTVIFNDLGMRITLGRNGITVDAAGKKVDVNNASMTTVNGPVTINGNLVVNGNTTVTGNATITQTLSGATVRQGSINLGTHTHKENGTGGGTTSGPQ